MLVEDSLTLCSQAQHTCKTALPSGAAQQMIISLTAARGACKASELSQAQDREMLRVAELRLRN